MSADGEPARVAGRFEAVTWMLVAATCFTAQSLLIKELSATLPLAVIVLLRHAGVLVLLVPWILVRSPAVIVTRRLRLHFVRALIGTASLVLFIYALRFLALADAVSISFSTPLIAVVLAILFLGERVGWRRGVAIGCGFVGILIILQPSGEYHPAMLAALGSAAMSATVVVFIKKLTVTETPLVMVFYFALFGTLIASIPAALTWQTPSRHEAFLVSAVCLFGLIGIYSTARAYRLADASVVAPVDFCRLPIAAVLGFLAFREVPGLETLVGTLVILVATIYITRREKVLAADTYLDQHALATARVSEGGSIRGKRGIRG